MYLKKNGTVLISTVIILSLMSILGCFMFKMMKNNNELGALYKFDKDIYDLDKDEEEILYKFMEELNNKNKTDTLNNQNEDSIDKDNEQNSEEIKIKISKDKSDNENVFSEDFILQIEDSSLEYHKNNHKIYLITNKDNEINRRREITYIFKKEKIILIPTFKFEDKANSKK